MTILPVVLFVIDFMHRGGRVLLGCDKSGIIYWKSIMHVLELIEIYTMQTGTGQVLILMNA